MHCTGDSGCGLDLDIACYFLAVCQASETQVQTVTVQTVCTVTVCTWVNTDKFNDKSYCKFTTDCAGERIITVRRSALHGICDSNSVRLSVCHTRGLCPHGSTYDHDFFTIW